MPWLPFKFDFQAAIEVGKPDKLNDFASLLTYYAMAHGNASISIVLVLFGVIAAHKINAGRILNRGNHFHRHTMLWYWICSKVLGYNKCKLMLVPIYSQFKLVLADTFAEYDYGADDYYEVVGEEEVALNTKPAREDTDCSTPQTVNIVISDTYPLTEKLLPPSCLKHETITLQRKTNEQTKARCYSPTLVKAVVDTVRTLPNGCRVNVFPTTNPKNTYMIVYKAFKTGGRDNIGSLYVYKQPNNESYWHFAEKGVRIYPRMVLRRIITRCFRQKSSVFSDL